MGIFFNNNLGMKTNIENTNTDGKQIVSGKLSNLPEYIAALKEGSVFKGEILDVRNNAVKILLGSNDILNARTDGSVPMNIGDILNFKVESNTGINMLVKAVFAENVNSNNMLLNALQSADIPVNERNLALVKELVNNGQPIDKATIKTLVSNLNSFKELTVDTAVNMYKHNISINSDNVIQFNNYIEQNNKLVTSFNELADNIVDTVKGFVNSNPEGDGVELLNNILKTLTGKADVNITTTTKEELYANMSVTETKIISSPQETKIIDLPQETVSLENFKEGLTQETVITNNETFEAQAGNKAVSEKMVFNSGNIAELIDDFKENIKKELGKALFLDRALLELPEEELKKEVEKYYKDIASKTDKLMHVLENAGLEKSSLHQNVANIKANVNFMNDLSNMALYMQLPVKFQDSEAHGELYVLNRNKGKQVEKDVLTAFLHLDMENLGATDVSIRLEKEQLTTKFTLKDVISQDIVEEHLPELKKRLDEKGYNATLLIEEITDTEEQKMSPFEQVLKLEEPKNYIKRYTLDVRA